MSDEASRKSLVAAFEALAGVLEARGRHGFDDPRVVRLRDVCVQALRRHLDVVGWTGVEFRDGAVLRFGKLVLADSSDAPLAAVLEGCGIGGLSIERHVVQAELHSLVEVLTRDWGHRSVFEEDLTAAVWRLDFQNVHVDLVEVGSFDEAHVSPDVSRLRRALLDGRTSEWAVFRPTPEVAMLLPKLQRELAPAEVDLGAGKLDSIDCVVLERELDAIHKGEDVDDDQVAQVLFETVRLEEDRGRAEQLGRSVARLALDRLSSGDTAGMACLVRRVLVLSRPPFRGRYEQVQAFQAGLATIVDAEHRPRVIAGLDRLDEPLGARQDLFLFLTALPADKAEDIARLAYACPWIELAQTIADALLSVLAIDRGRLRSLLERDEDEVAFAPLLAYSRLSATQMLGACLLRTRSAEPRIREAALRSCRRHTDERVGAAALALIEDSDSRVRIEALRHVAVSRHPRAASLLEERLGSPSMERVSESELKAWMMAFGMVARAEAVEPLVDILLDRRSVPGRHPRLKSFAVRGLMATGSRESQEALNDIAKRVPEVRDTIRELRSEMARR
ncbi:MAG: hypothetical protein GY913_14395 [Proteobacteria bacterium]|nr:hypothetical protein [Pseudomonadota bacterium]MCP4918099.1 hypothetical protein [Pseudomonadota bacterium]